MKEKLLFDPYPRTMELILSPGDRKRLESLFEVISWDSGRMPSGTVEKSLPDVMAVVGQTDLPRKRLAIAEKLKAIINVEGNFLQNIDYEYCFQKGIHVLNAGIAFSEAVAEISLAFALSLARDIPRNDRLFRVGNEIYGRKSNSDSFLLKGKKVGIIGLGNIGKALLRLLKPFGVSIGVYDPWLPGNHVIQMGCKPESLQDLLETSKIIFLVAGATTENRAMIGEAEIGAIKKGSIFILTSRASLVDFTALIERLKKGDIKAAIDVFPEEPFAKDSILRKLDNVLLSAHRAGGIPEAYRLIGEMVVDDLELITKGLPPVRLQKANLEIVAKLASKPVK